MCGETGLEAQLAAAVADARKQWNVDEHLGQPEPSKIARWKTAWAIYHNHFKIWDEWRKLLKEHEWRERAPAWALAFDEMQQQADIKKGIKRKITFNDVWWPRNIGARVGMGILKLAIGFFLWGILIVLWREFLLSVTDTTRTPGFGIWIILVIVAWLLFFFKRPNPYHQRETEGTATLDVIKASSRKEKTPETVSEILESPAANSGALSVETSFEALNLPQINIPCTRPRESDNSSNAHPVPTQKTPIHTHACLATTNSEGPRPIQINDEVNQAILRHNKSSENKITFRDIWWPHNILARVCMGLAKLAISAILLGLVLIVFDHASRLFPIDINGVSAYGQGSGPKPDMTNFWIQGVIIAVELVLWFVITLMLFLLRRPRPYHQCGTIGTVMPENGEIKSEKIIKKTEQVEKNWKTNDQASNGCLGIVVLALVLVIVIAVIIFIAPRPQRQSNYSDRFENCNQIAQTKPGTNGRNTRPFDPDEWLADAKIDAAPQSKSIIQEQPASYAIMLFGIPRPVTMTFPSGFMVANDNEARNRRERLLEYYRLNPSMKGRYNEILLGDWKSGTVYPQIIVGVLGVTEKYQGKITRKDWNEFRKMFSSMSSSEVAKIRSELRPNIEKSSPIEKKTLEELLWFEEQTDLNSVIILGQTRIQLADKKLDLFAARKLIYYNGYLVFSEIAVDSSKPDALKQLRNYLSAIAIEKI